MKIKILLCALAATESIGLNASKPSNPTEKSQSNLASVAQSMQAQASMQTVLPKKKYVVSRCIVLKHPSMLDICICPEHKLIHSSYRK